MLTDCLAPGDMHVALHPGFLVEHVEMSVEGNIVRLSLESLATRHYYTILIWMYSHTDLEANYKLPWLGFLKHCMET